MRIPVARWWHRRICMSSDFARAKRLAQSHATERVQLSTTAVPRGTPNLPGVFMQKKKRVLPPQPLAIFCPEWIRTNSYKSVSWPMPKCFRAREGLPVELFSSNAMTHGGGFVPTSSVEGGRTGPITKIRCIQGLGSDGFVGESQAFCCGLMDPTITHSSQVDDLGNG
mmetsp:Transcript_41105/g.56022  ORF Transcript_41105/g.56022 Transcript_41105/m.56022 type:complete len:168 (-) Transcript_41105:22-525(-)